jgi:tetratricopeptide (TPR) repeat protein
VNLALHLVNAVLVLAIARVLLARLATPTPTPTPTPTATAESAALLAALLFAVHPVHTQAVTYVVQRMTVMGATFALAAIRLWLSARERRGRAFAVRAAAAAIATWLAISCKENFVVVPGIVLVLEAVLAPDLGAALRARRREVAVAAVALAAAGALLLRAYRPVIAAEQARLPLPIAERLLSQGRVLLHYLSLLALPLPGRLHVDYAWPPSTGLLSPPATLLALLAVALLAALAVATHRRAPLVALAIGWFLVALAVEQSVLPVDLAFEQRLYFADVGLLLLAGAALARAARAVRVAPWALASPVILLLAAGTFARNERWRDPALLYADDAGTGPGAARGLLSVAAALRARGDLDGAERALRRAVTLAPDEAGAYVNLGNVALDRGRLDEAEARYREALARDRHRADAWYDLGILLDRRGRSREAMDAYRAAVAADSAFTSARVNLALLELGAGDPTGALATLDEAVRVDPGGVSALANRAVVRSVLGRHAEALDDARAAVRLGPDRQVAWLALAEVAEAAGLQETARQARERAQRLPH